MTSLKETNHLDTVFWCILGYLHRPGRLDAMTFRTIALCTKTHQKTSKSCEENWFCRCTIETFWNSPNTCDSLWPYPTDFSNQTCFILYVRCVRISLWIKSTRWIVCARSELATFAAWSSGTWQRRRWECDTWGCVAVAGRIATQALREGTNWKTGLEQNRADMSSCFIETNDSKRVNQNEFGIWCLLFRLDNRFTAYELHMIWWSLHRLDEFFRACGASICLTIHEIDWNSVTDWNIHSDSSVFIISSFVHCRVQTSLPHCRASGRGCCPDGPCLGGRNGTKLQVACRPYRWRKTVEIGSFIQTWQTYVYLYLYWNLYIHIMYFLQ